MKKFSLLRLFPVYHPDLYNVSGNETISECKAKSLDEAILIFVESFPFLNNRGYAEQNEISFCVASNFS